MISASPTLSISSMVCILRSIQEASLGGSTAIARMAVTVSGTGHQIAFSNAFLSRNVAADCERSQCSMHQGSAKDQKNIISRRSFINFATKSALIISTGALRRSSDEESWENESFVSDSSPQQQNPGCRNCQGSGKISCELCAGTGFWRALSGNDPNQRYKGVVCPECEGSGSLTCPVCLGTGEGNVKGLLRRRKVEPGPGRTLQSV